MRSYSRIVEGLQGSRIAETGLMAQRMGNDVVHLETGDLECTPPSELAEYFGQAFEQGATHYGEARGDGRLVQAIVDDLREQDHYCAPAEEVLVVPGGSMGVFLAIQSVVNPGDEVILVAPVWPHYIEMVKLVGGGPIVLNTQARDGFFPSPDQLRRLISPKTKAIVLNTPNNPTGTVYSEELLRMLSAVCNKAGVRAICDEEYINFFAGDRPVCGRIASDNILVCRSFSKTLACAGLRLGFLSGPRRWIELIEKSALFTHMYASSLTQRAVALAYENGIAQRYATKLRSEYMARSAELSANLDDCQEMNCAKSHGGVYVWPRLCLGDNSSEFAEELLRKERIAVVPGAAFGSHCGSYLRVSLALPAAAIPELGDRIRRCVRAYRKCR